MRSILIVEIVSGDVHRLAGGLGSGDPGLVAHQLIEIGPDLSLIHILLLPVLVLIAVCTTGMIYVGGFFGVDAWGGTDCAGDFIGAFGNTDAFMGLPWGGIIALLFTVIYLVARRVIPLYNLQSGYI